MQAGRQNKDADGIYAIPKGTCPPHISRNAWTILCCSAASSHCQPGLDECGEFSATGCTSADQARRRRLQHPEHLATYRKLSRRSGHRCHLSFHLVCASTAMELLTVQGGRQRGLHAHGTMEYIRFEDVGCPACLWGHRSELCGLCYCMFASHHFH